MATTRNARNDAETAEMPRRIRTRQRVDAAELLWVVMAALLRWYVGGLAACGTVASCEVLEDRRCGGEDRLT
ncbi:hypothetical protein GCM10010381_61720 [Streptomyces xantholiticus]|nr:hypothetical protein GCM10010381_61720 [Streptomyces xantholiticus]